MSESPDDYAVYDTFTHECGDCKTTVTVEKGVELPHECI